ncbi:unnamed protein product [Protopolystoma xenopodis]|uniref:Fibronectin type-III domain-containing protein n=1 Tax=Protopolystoma xenopodis TaxID=117903 RepID=A0A3S5BWR8_9PLAT|nr:unnamed protein product [Protopolystoma xenopodis]
MFIYPQVPDPPRYISAIRINPHQIKVTWGDQPFHLGSLSGVNHLTENDNLPGQFQHPKHQPGQQIQRRVPITGFCIYYATNDNPDNEHVWKRLVVGAVNSATLFNLDAMASYVVRIKARGADLRYGPWSEPAVTDHPPSWDDAPMRSASLPIQPFQPLPFPPMLGRFYKETDLEFPQLACQGLLPRQIEPNVAAETAKAEASLLIQWYQPDSYLDIIKYKVRCLYDYFLPNLSSKKF